MADTEIPNLAAIATIGDNDVIHIVSGGVSKKVTPSQLTAYFEGRGRQVNAAVANQAFAASDAYIAGSYVTIPAGRLQAKSLYRMRMQIAKTSTAGTATPIATVRLGTAGTTADTARATLTFPAQTAVADDGFLEVFVTFRAVGASTGVISCHGILDHRLAATGLVNTNTGFAKAVSSAFDTTVANLGIGVSFNGGASFAGNTDLVQTELMNLG